MTFELNTDYQADEAQAFIEAQEDQELEICFCRTCGEDYIYSIVHRDGHECPDCKQTKY